MSRREPLGLSRALVVGLARSGSAAALALRRHDCSVIGVDTNPERDVGRLREEGVEVQLGAGLDPATLEGVEVVVKSPGVPAAEPFVAHARQLGLPIWSEVELGARLLPQRIAGVTGTNGKTTTSELLGEMARSGGRAVEVAGNVGYPLTSVEADEDPDAWVVCELSSFQLEDVHRFRADVAVLLNVAPDHLDRHGSFEAYRDAKLRVFENQTEADAAIVPRGFGAIPGTGSRIEFDGGDVLPREPRIAGPHNRENAVAATLAARAMGVDENAIGSALASFPGLAHRLELVGEVAGVRYVNDSKATNPEAASRAFEAYAGAHAILGGSLKGSSFDELAAAAKEHSLRRAYLIGEAAAEIAAALERASVAYECVDDLRSAVMRASAESDPGDVVLLSPACASFDQFRDFEHRGDCFRDLVSRL